MRTFEDIISEYRANHGLNEKLLNFCHSTHYKTLVSHILPDVELKASSECEYHKGEKIIFFFYGKASYYPPNQQGDKFDKRNPPVTLIYDDVFDVGEVKRLCCFDTGAYVHGILDIDDEKADESLLPNFIKPEPTKEDFIAGIEALYGNNDNYLNNRFDPAYKVDEYPTCFCLLKVDELHKNREFNRTEYGPQAFSFELQITDSFKKTPIAVVIPQTIAVDAKAIKDWQKQFPSSEIKIYDFSIDRHAISVAYNNMREMVFEYNSKVH